MKAGTPFRRALLMFAAITAAMKIGDRGLRGAALADIRPYRSRGKGRSYSKRQRSSSTHGTSDWAPDKRNGARECARRMRQMANGTHGYVHGGQQLAQPKGWGRSCNA